MPRQAFVVLGLFKVKTGQLLIFFRNPSKLSRRSRSQLDYSSDGGVGIITHKRPKKRSDGSIQYGNYYDGNRTPSPAYNETKASILRRRKNHKPNENEEEDLEEALRPSLQAYASLQDLSRLQHHGQGNLTIN